jgi:hypothetical protein
MFLEQDVFEGLKPTLQNPPSYEKARIGFVPYNPTTAAADANFYESKLGVSTPGDGGPGGSGF